MQSNIERYERFKVAISQTAPMDMAFAQMTVSEYELLVMTIYKLNDLISVTNGYSQLIDDILDWILGEGLEQGIKNKLDGWLLDGTLEEIINEALFNTKLDKTEFEENKITVKNLIDKKLEKNTVRVDFNDYIPDKTGMVDVTDKLVLALADSVNKILFIPYGTYKIRKTMIPSNTVIEFAPNTTIIANDDYAGVWHNPLIDIRLVNNVTIRGNGSTIKMNKAFYNSEHDHCLGIRGSKNVTIENLNLNDSGGDGIYIDGMDGSEVHSSQDIIIRGCKMDNNRRQGMSVLGVKNLLVEACIFSNTNGTAPNCGVDIEPEFVNDYLEGIIFRDCVSYGNDYFNYLVDLRVMNTDVFVEITFDNCISNGSKGFLTSGIKEGGKGVIKYLNCTSNKSKVCGFLDAGNSNNSVKRIYNSCSVYDNNQSNYPSDDNHKNDYGYGASLLIDNLTGGGVGNFDIINCNLQGGTNSNYGIAIVSTGGALEKHKDINIINNVIEKQNFSEVVLNTWKLDNYENTVFQKFETTRNAITLNHLNQLISITTPTEPAWFSLPDNFIEGAVIRIRHNGFPFRIYSTSNKLSPYATVDKKAILFQNKGCYVEITYTKNQWFITKIVGDYTITNP